MDIAEQYIAEANALEEPISAIDRYLLAIDVMQIHIGRMDTTSQLVQLDRVSRANADEAPSANPSRASDRTNDRAISRTSDRAINRA